MLIAIIALSFRLYGLNWDQSQHFHPDERMITMVAQNISFPNDLSQVFYPNSPLNPKFFAYGSFPLYLLKFTASVVSLINPIFLSYDFINLLGRLLSSVFDTLAIFFIYRITLLLFNSKSKGLLASALYSITVFPVQLSHFYAVDTVLNFFILWTLYNAIKLHLKFSFKNAIWIGISFGLALATKVSAIVLVVSLGVALIASVILSLKKEVFGTSDGMLVKIIKFFQKTISPKFWFNQQRAKLIRIMGYSFLIIFSTIIVFVICEPFSVFDFPTFWRQINEQSAMTKDALVFPYTLQYYGTLPYIYQLKNIFLWGLGPIIGIFAFFGTLATLYSLVKGLLAPGNEEIEGNQLIIVSFFISYFLVVGDFAVKFMRYCLPLYPILVIFAANYLINLKQYKKIVIPLVLVTQFILCLGFIGIYSTPNTRNTATQWIINNIPKGSVILREHWDDGLPVGTQDYITQELALYDPDIIPDKWTVINNQLNSADYLVIASNRLYTPLQKMTNCALLPQYKCYPITAKYYQDLFSGKLGFTKIAEFSSYPKIFGFSLNDQSADESFTVYDHPKIMIFQKQK